MKKPLPFQEAAVALYDRCKIVLLAHGKPSLAPPGGMALTLNTRSLIIGYWWIEDLGCVDIWPRWLGMQLQGVTL